MASGLYWILTEIFSGSRPVTAPWLHLPLYPHGGGFLSVGKLDERELISRMRPVTGMAYPFTMRGSQ